MGIHKGTGRLPPRIEIEEERPSEASPHDRLADIGTAMAAAVAFACLAYVLYTTYAQ